MLVKPGILLIDKPQGLTSHDVVNVVRRKFNTRRIGHSGTLDPLATGLLIILVAGATKLFNRFANFDKEYLATLKLGQATDSGDSQGKVTKCASFDAVTRQQVETVLKGIEGKFENVPPMVSAIRHQGKRLYQLARKGLVVERKARTVDVYKLELLDFSLPQIRFLLKCSKGTYVRTLAEEIALRLNCVGHIIEIRRLAIGDYCVREAKQLDDFNENDIRTC